MRYLADLDWLALSSERGRTRIDPGPLARKQIEEATAPGRYATRTHGQPRFCGVGSRGQLPCWGRGR